MRAYGETRDRTVSCLATIVNTTSGIQANNRCDHIWAELQSGFHSGGRGLVHGVKCFISSVAPQCVQCFSSLVHSFNCYRTCRSEKYSKCCEICLTCAAVKWCISCVQKCLNSPPPHTHTHTLSLSVLLFHLLIICSSYAHNM